MDENLLQYIWKHKLYDDKETATVDGQHVVINNPGQLNCDAGPDFFDARVTIDGTRWAGCVEIHLRASDWYMHGHDTDKSYNNVILHVVLAADTTVQRENGTDVPTIELQFNERLQSNYARLKNSSQWIACEDYFGAIDPMVKSMWMEPLLIQRLERKTVLIKKMLDDTTNNLDEVFYRLLAKNMGFKTNAQPFEQLARQTPLKIFRAIGQDRYRIEALIFGQAGFLEQCSTTYQKELRKEYNHLKNRYELDHVDPVQWKFARMRPVNFPTIRLAQFCDILSHSTRFTDNLCSFRNIEHIEFFFEAGVSRFWENHYTFQKESKKRDKALGIASIHTIIINSVFPFLFVVSKIQGDYEMEKRVFSWMEALPEEKNSIIDKWKSIGAEVQSAYQSQAYLELYNQYCSTGKCLDCRLGGYVLNEL